MKQFSFCKAKERKGGIADKQTSKIRTAKSNSKNFQDTKKIIRIACCFVFISETVF